MAVVFFSVRHKTIGAGGRFELPSLVRTCFMGNYFLVPPTKLDDLCTKFRSLKIFKFNLKNFNFCTGK